jgi:hypothetical protein
MHEGEAGVAQFLIASGHSTALFQLVEHARHLLTSLVLRSVIPHGGLAMPLGRDDGRYLPGLEVVATLLPGRPFSRDARPQLGPRRTGLQARRQARGIMAGSAGQLEGHPGLFVKAAGVACGGTPTPSAAQRLGRVSAMFFRAPAAC